MRQEVIAEFAVRHPMFEQRLHRALSISRERLAWVSGVKQELLDFFVRRGGSRKPGTIGLQSGSRSSGGSAQAQEALLRTAADIQSDEKSVAVR